MSWLAALPTFAAAVLAVFVPGLAIAAAAGARRLVLYAAAPAVTVAVLAVAAVLFGAVGVPWTLLTVGAATVALAGLALIVRRVVTGRWFVSAGAALAPPIQGARLGRGWTIVSLIVGAALIFTQLALVIGSPGHVSQTLDGMFHLNAVQYVIDQQDASSLHLTGLILPAGHTSFYPAGWHAVASIAAYLNGGAVVAAANMTNIVIAALVWPAGVMLLVRLLAPKSRAAVLAVGPLSAAFPGFPILPLDYGVLFSYFSSLALLPLGLALALSFSGFVRMPAAGWGTRLSLLFAVVLACGLTQPAGALALVALLMPVLLAMVIRAAKGKSWLTAVALYIGFCVVAIAAAVIWKVAAGVGSGAPWGPKGGFADALWGLFTNTRLGSPVAVVASVLVVVGLVVVLRRSWWLAAMWGVAAFLYVVVMALPEGDWRNFIVGPFYKDIPRLIALLAVVSVPLAVLGAAAVWRSIPQGFALATRRRARAAVAAVGAVVLVLAAGGPGIQAAMARGHAQYDPTNAHAFLSPDEMALISRLPAQVPPDAVIAGSPWTGTAFAYALSGRRVLNPHFYWSPDPATRLVNEHLNEARTDPQVCDAVLQLNVRFVLDFGVVVETNPDYVTFDSRKGYEGLTHLKGSGVVEPVDRVGDKVLYRIVACGLGEAQPTGRQAGS